jgi:hypothetical protein
MAAGLRTAKRKREYGYFLQLAVWGRAALWAGIFVVVVVLYSGLDKQYL